MSQGNAGLVGSFAKTRQALRILADVPTVALVLMICVVGPLPAREVQSHGLLFEKWLRDTFFGGLRAEGLHSEMGHPGDGE